MDKKNDKKMGRPAAEGPLTPLLEAAGGYAKLATMMGVGVGTLSRWQRRKMEPAQPARKLLAMLAAQRGLPPPFEVGA